MHAYRDDTFTLDLGARYQCLNLDPEPDDSFFDGEGGARNPWSWRVNYGYQAASNIFPKRMSGQIKSNDEADTNIGGLTLGKMFQAPARRGGFVDPGFWGSMSLRKSTGSTQTGPMNSHLFTDAPLVAMAPGPVFGTPITGATSTNLPYPR